MSSGPEVHYGDLLERVTEDFRRKGFKFQRYIDDQYGKYGAVFTALQEPIPFVLVAKGSQALQGDYVSFQRSLVEAWRGPIVLAWIPYEESPMRYLVFDPARILFELKRSKDQGLREAWENEFRAGCWMINFSILIGRNWKPPEEPLINVWNQVKEDTEAKKRQSLKRYF